MATFDIALRDNGTNAFDISLSGAMGPTGQIKVWIGGAWTPKPVKYWTGSEWVTKPLKYWDGDSWVVTPY